nr:discoidin domain-containing protein [Acidobacteriota bacterium]
GLDFSTFIGGLRREIGEGVAADAAGNVYVAGYTISPDFPNSNAEPHRQFTDDDAFVMKLAAPTPPPAPCSALSNLAASANGATATASSTYPDRDYRPEGAIDGDRAGANWAAGGGWNDATYDAWPDWLQVDFNDVKRIHQVRVYTVQNEFLSPSEPDAATPANLYGIRDFDVQYWDGAAWATAAQVRGNDKAMAVILLPQGVTTDRIRVHVAAGRENFSRVVEAEAFGCPAL